MRTNRRRRIRASIVGMALGAIAALYAGSARAAQTAKEVVGEWEGSSICTVKDSPCHDEHVIYVLRAEKEGSRKMTLKGYKVVNGEREWMGDLGCEYDEANTTLACVFSGSKGKNEWLYKVSGDSMKGTLRIGEEKTLYRKIEVKKNS